MAAKKQNTNRAKKQAPQQSAAPEKNPRYPRTPDPKTLTMEQLAEYGRRALEMFAEQDREREQRLAEAEAYVAKRKAFKLTPDRVELATQAIDQINLSAVAINQLASAATESDGGSEGQWYLVAMQDTAKLTARRCDYVKELLTGVADLGNFASEIDVAAALQAVALEREQEADHA